jgi:hypothetical protein
MPTIGAGAVGADGFSNSIFLFFKNDKFLTFSTFNPINGEFSICKIKN